MKKILVGIIAVILAASFQGCKNKPANKPTLLVVKKPSLGPCTNCKTLNGVDEVTAKAMINVFQSFEKNDNSPLPTSVWFSNKTIHSIDSLLNAEIAIQEKADPNRRDITSGIRIYFACDPSVTTPPLKTSILLVSTYDSLKYPSGKSPHRDYYVHNASFLSSQTGEVSHNTKEPGARLYKQNILKFLIRTGKCIIKKDHLITASQSYNWVKNYVGSKIPINTFSEWFDLNFFDDLDEELQNKKNHPDGVRIYFAFRDQDPDHTNIKNRHVFVIITTKSDNNVHRDYFDCKTPSYPIGGDNGELCQPNCQ
jgi:hypothetical protein